MTEFISNETLQPSLLDRLADNEPNEKKESRDKRVLSTKQLRLSVIRDLSWLLNTCNQDMLGYIEKYPFAKESVINYGMPDLSGRVATGMDINQLEKIIKKIITFYEPRLIKKSVSVKVITTDAMDKTAIKFDIEADLWAQPLPLHLYLRTELDLETGEITLENKG